MANEPSSQIEIQSTIEQLPDLQHWVEKLALEFLLPPPLVQRIDICLTELVSNVICYGYPNGEPGTVRICFWHQPEQIVIRIDDDATSFDPTAYVLPGLPSSLADATPGGRGIRLVRHFTDELHHVTGPAGNQLTLVFRNEDTAMHSSSRQ